jgi:predicted AAA+ superfamily ATPase
MAGDRSETENWQERLRNKRAERSAVLGRIEAEVKKQNFRVNSIRRSIASSNKIYDEMLAISRDSSWGKRQVSLADAFEHHAAILDRMHDIKQKIDARHSRVLVSIYMKFNGELVEVAHFGKFDPYDPSRDSSLTKGVNP